MSALGSLIVKLGLEYAQYTQGLDKTEQETLTRAKKIQDAMDKMQSRVTAAVGGVAGVLAATMSINAFKGMLDGAVEAAAGLDDLAQHAGTTVEALSGLASIGKFSDFGADAISGAMNKLTKNLTSVTEESAGTGKAIQLLGLDLQGFKSMKPEDQMMAVAKALDGFADGAGKSAVMMALYGKEGAKMIPLMADLAKVGELQAKITTEQTQAAANYDDNLKRINASSEAWKKELVTGMIPALDLAAQAYLDVMNGNGGLRDEVKKLSADGSIRTWTQDAITGLSYVMDAGQTVVRVFRSVGQGIYSLGAAAFAFANGNLGQAKAYVESFWDDVKQPWSEQTLGQSFRDRMEDLKNVGAQAQKTKQDLDTSSLNIRDKTGAKEAESAYDKLNKTLQERINLVDAQLQAGRQLTDIEKFEVKLLGDMQAAKDKLSATDREDLAAKLDALKAKEALKDLTERGAKADLAAAEAHSKYLDSLDSGLDKLKAEILAQQEQTERLGLNAIGIANLDAAKLELLATEKELLAIKQLDKNGDEGTYTRLMAQADSYRALAKAKLDNAYRQTTLDFEKGMAEASARVLDEATQAANKVNDTLTDALMRGFESGKDFAANFKDTIVNMFKTMILRPVVAAVVLPISQALTGGAANAATSVMGSALGSAGTSLLGGTAGGLLGTATGAISGFTTALTAGAQSLIGMTGTTAQMVTSLVKAGHIAAPGMASGMSAAAAVPYVAVAALVANALGLFRTTKKVGAGITGTLGDESDLQGYDLMRKSGTLFSGPSYSLRQTDLAADVQKSLSESARSILESARAQARALGLSTDALQGFTAAIGTDLLHPDTGGLGLKFDGLNEQQIQEKLSAALQGFSDAAARQLLDSLDKAQLPAWMTRVIDTLADAPGSQVLTALAQYPDAMLAAIGQTRDGLKGVFLQALKTGDADAAGQAVADAVMTGIEDTFLGGFADKMVNILTQGILTPVIDAYLNGQSITQALSAASIQEAVNQAQAAAAAFGAVWNNADFQAALSSLRETISTGVGSAANAAAFKPRADQVQAPSPEAPTSTYQGAVDDAASKANETLKGLLDERAGLEQQLAQTMGDTARVTALITAGYDEQSRAAYAVNQGLQAQIAGEQVLAGLRGNTQALQRDLIAARDGSAAAAAYDLAEATKALTVDQRVAAAVQAALNASLQAAIKSESDKKDLQQQLLAVTETQAEAQARLRAGYDAANQAIFDQLTAAKAAKAEADQRKTLEQQWLQLSGQTGELRRIELAAILPANRALQESIWALEDLKTAHDKAKESTDKAWASVDRAATAERKRLDAARDIASKSVDTLKSVFDTLGGAAKDLYAQVLGTQQAQAKAGMQVIDQALATGVLPAQQALQDAISSARQALRPDAFGSRAEYDYAQLVLAGKLTQLQAQSGDQLTAAEQALQVAEDSLTRLDEQLQAAKDLLDATRGVDVSTQSVTQAIESLHAALVNEGRTATPSGSSAAVAPALEPFVGQAGALWTDSWVRAAGDSTLYRPDEFKALVNQAVSSYQGALNVLQGLADAGMSDSLFESRMGWSSGTIAGFRATSGHGATLASTAVPAAQPQQAEAQTLRREGEARAQALAIVTELRELRKLHKSWNSNGLPATRDDGDTTTVQVLAA